MNTWKPSVGSILLSILLVAQYVLTFFVFGLPAANGLQWAGWAVWVLSLLFGFAPIFIFRRKGGVAAGKSYVETTRLVTSSLYAVVRHPQYVGGILFSLAMMLVAQHGVIVGLGVVVIFLIYRAIQEGDQEALEKFGDEYRQYMQRVPQVNFILGILRVARDKQAARRMAK